MQVKDNGKKGLNKEELDLQDKTSLLSLLFETTGSHYIAQDGTRVTLQPQPMITGMCHYLIFLFCFLNVCVCTHMPVEVKDLAGGGSLLPSTMWYSDSGCQALAQASSSTESS